MAMFLRSAATRALLLRSSASAVAPLAAVAIVASRRFFSSHRSTAKPAATVASRRFFRSNHSTAKPAAAAIVASRRFFSSHHSTAKPAAVAIVASRRFFSSYRSTARPAAATNGGGEGDEAQRPVDRRIEETREQLLRLYLSKTPLPTTAEVATDLTGVFRRFQEGKARQHGETFEGEPFVGEEAFEGELFDTEAYEADASVAGYSFSGGTYTGGYHSGDIFMEDPHPVAGSGDSWR